MPLRPRPCSALRTRALGLLGALAACSTTPVAAPEAERRLDSAEAQLAAADADGAEQTLAPLAEEACPRRLRPRRDVALAKAALVRNELWDAFLVLQPFPDLYPHSELRSVVGDMVWTIGKALSESDRGFWFFWDDRTSGRTALEHLITRHPEHQNGGEALRILGDIAFEDENFELAEQRYRDLMLNQPEGEWFAYAQYRFAMSIAASVQGADYDLDRMEHAVRELRDFLRPRRENPAIVQSAEQTLAQLQAWRASRHLQIADFYRTVGSTFGERHHLELASQAEFAGIEAHTAASARLAAMPANAGSSTSGGGP